MEESDNSSSRPEELPIEGVFESAVSIVRNLPKEGPIKPSDELKLKLYAYFKQATHGPNDTKKPRFYQIVELYKWDAWRKLGHMSKDQAMMSYINELKQIMETIPPEQAAIEENKRFEDILGKKFYDYWFNEYNKLVQQQSEQTGQVQHDDVTTPDGYWTPTRSTSEPSLTSEMSHQFMDAVLRLQQHLRSLDAGGQ